MLSAPAMLKDEGVARLEIMTVSALSQVEERDWRMTFLPQFEACARAGTFSFMCSYNRYVHPDSFHNLQRASEVLVGLNICECGDLFQTCVWERDGGGNSRERAEI